MIWSFGWLMFAGVEIISRIFNWLPLPSPIPLLMLVLYAGLGVVAGGTVGILSFLVLRSLGKRVQHITMMRFFMASCITTVVLFYGGMLAYEKLLLHTSGPVLIAGILGYILLSLVLFILLCLVFRRSFTCVTLLSSFCTLVLSIDVFMVGIVYVNEILLPGRVLAFFFRDVVVNLGFLFSCITLYFLLSVSLNFFFSRWLAVNNRLSLRARWIGVFVLILFLGGLWYTVSSMPFRRPSAVLHDKPNVILITMDTTRADHLSCYGYHRKTTPYLDQFAQESVLFTNSYTPSSWTLPAHASIFTGMYPAKHGARVNADFTRYLLDRYGTALKGSTGIDTQGFAEQSVMYLGEENITLAELLSAAGICYCRSNIRSLVLKKIRACSRI